MSFGESNPGNYNGVKVQHLYVHIPFCPKICPYCSFYKEASDRNRTQAFLDGLLQELAGTEVELKCRTIFFGGGTPSALSVKQLKFLLGALRQRLDLSDLEEWTLEMNPATVSLEKAQLLREFGVNRVSMGVQSFDSEVLRRLGRVHSGEQAFRSFELLRAAGYTNLNLDFIFGVPGQSPRSWEETLDQAIRLQPEHISTYCLTYEEDTEFFRRWQRGEFRTDIERDAAYFEISMSKLAGAEYLQYEISNYSRPGYECLHNLAYWQGANYLGLGPSAFSTVGNCRWQNIPDTAAYLNRPDRISFREEVTPEIKRAERLAFGLRMNQGVPESQFTSWPDQLKDLAGEGYLEREHGRIRLTPRGRMVADAIAELFV